MFEYFDTGLTYITIGLAVAVFCRFVARWSIVGEFWGALIVGLLGAVIGGLVDQWLEPILRNLSNFNSVNVFAAVFGSVLLIWIVSKIGD